MSHGPAGQTLGDPFVSAGTRFHRLPKTDSLPRPSGRSFPHDRSFVSGLVRSRRRREWRHRLVIRRTWRGARRSPDGDLATPLGYRLGLGPIHPSQVSTISGSGRCSTQRRSRCRDLQTSSRANGRLGTMITIGQAGFGRTNPSPASLQRSAEPPAYNTPSKSNPGQREDGKTRVNTELNGPLPRILICLL